MLRTVVQIKLHKSNLQKQNAAPRRLQPESGESIQIVHPEAKIVTSHATRRYLSRILLRHATYASVMHGPSRAVFVAWMALITFQLGPVNAYSSELDEDPASSQYAQGSSALHRAAAQGSAEEVKRLLTRGADVNAQDDHGRTPLLVAIEQQHIDAAKALLDHGADVEKQTTSGISSLYAAAFHGRQQCLEVLIDRGADVNARCALGRTALFPAAAEGHTECVRTLLKHGADAKVRTEASELAKTALHGAAVEGQVETARILLDHGADPNAQDDKWKITPLYLAAVLGHGDFSTLLLSQGADPSIVDASGMTPAMAGSLMAERSSRELAAADPTGRLNPRAVVYLIYLGRTHRGYRLKGARLAFAVGDGRYLITASHCVDDFQNDPGDAIATPLLISAHYGDLFQAEIVSTDQASDVAILRAPWQKHPALNLAPWEHVALAKQVAVVGYPQHQEKARLTAEVFLEQLSAIKVNTSAEKRALCLSAARFVGPGWSGAPIILPKTGQVAGVFNSHDLVQIDQKVVLHNLYGCDVQAIDRLLRTNRLSLTPAVEVVEGEHSSKADDAFVLLLRFFERFMQGDVDGKLDVAGQLKTLRPMSPSVRLLVALAAHEKFMTTHKQDDGARQTTDENFREALRLLADRDSTFTRVAYGCFLLFDGRHEEAAAQLREARQQAPRDTFIAVSLLRALTAGRSKEALTFGDALCREQPQNHQCWFEYAGALREFEKYDEAVDAAERSIRLGGPKFYQARLASVLAKAGQLDEAESVYKRMLDAQPHEGTFWLWYARFLIQDRSLRQDEARRAIDKAEEYSTPRTIPPAAIEELRAELDTK